jgi:hypothetical protein
MSPLKPNKQEETVQLVTGLQYKLASALDLTREFGVRRFIGEILPWHFYRRYNFYSLDLTKPGLLTSRGELTAEHAAPTDFRIQLASESEIKLIMSARPHFYSEKQLQLRLRDGHMCFLGWIQNEPIHLRWHFIDTVYLPYLKKTLKLNAQEVWADEAFTQLDHRRSGIYAHAGFQINHMLIEKGYKRLVCAFASWNKTPQRISLKRGMTSIGEVIHKNYFWNHNNVYIGRIRESEEGTIEIGE